MYKHFITMAVLLAMAALSSCDAQDSASTFYVIASESSSSHFMRDLATLAQRNGLAPNSGEAVDDHKRVTQALEARGRGLKIWSQNQPLSGQEDTLKCGTHSEAYTDPGQYIVTVRRVFPYWGKQAPAALAEQLAREINGLGYDVRNSAVLCSDLAKGVAY